MQRTRQAIPGIIAAAILLAVLCGLLPAVNGAASPPQTISAETQYAAAVESLLYVRCYYASGGLKTTGTGFIVGADGLAVTAAHVIDKAARVTAADSSGKEWPCLVISSDLGGDVAVLRLPKGSYKPLKLADKAPAGGATLRAMGYPVKDTPIITEGLLSSPCGTVSEKKRMLVTCDIVNGMSGGPVFDAYGSVVGLCSGSVRTMSGIHLSALWNDLYTAVTAAQTPN